MGSATLRPPVLLLLVISVTALVVAFWGTSRVFAASSPEPWTVTLDLSAGEVAAGETVTYSGVVSGAGGSAASGKVVVQKRLAGTSTWKEWRTPSLKVDGSYAVGVAMTTADRRWEFRAKKVADAANLTGYSPLGTLVVSGAVRETSSTEVTLFNIGGRGWGHGIGMSQYGAYGYAKHGWSYKSILRHYYSGISFAKTRNRTVRVLLASGQEKVRVSSGRAFKATDGTRTVSVPANTTASVTWTGSAYRVSAGGRSSTFARAVILKHGTRPLRLYNRNQNGWPSGTGGAHYRGDLKVVRSSGAFQVINHVTLESYLRGVVPRESPSSWPREALRAQAVVARSYAVRGIKGGGTYDLRCTAASQVYNGYDGEAASTNAAVAATAGVVPIFGGKPIVAYYFSTSGGRTENIENVWGGSPVGYLKSVGDPYDTYSPYHTWKDAPYRYSETTMAKKLGSLVPGTLRAVYITKKGKSPRAVSVAVLGQQGADAHAAIGTSGWTLRNKLGLRDTWFWIRSMSVSPANSDRATILYGERQTLLGRAYPAIGSGTRITLHYYRDGRWRTTKVPPSRAVKKSFTSRVDESAVSGGYTAYSFAAKPGRTTEYFFSSGKSRSPKTTVRVRPVLTIAADSAAVSAGDTVMFTGTVHPLTKAGATVELRREGGGSWIPVAEGTVAADGSYEIPWMGERGTWSFKVRAAAGDQMLANSSPVVTVSVE